jgi:hypothetical protein
MPLNFYYYPAGDKNGKSNLDHANTTSPLDPEKFHPLVDWLCFTMLACGIRAITAKNADEVTRRFAIHQRVFGPALRFHGGEQAYFVHEDTLRYIGFEVNVSDIPKSTFNARVVMWCTEKYEAGGNSRGVPAYELYAAKAAESKEVDHAG